MTIKTDEYFKIFYEGICAEARILTKESFLSRPRKPPARCADCLPTLHETDFGFYHHQYFEVINQVIDFVDSRFKQSAFPIVMQSRAVHSVSS
ncbi:unnamed protein product [Adineta ricciae]|uniref:Uncharacterized protein n=1 Tax=Adineta ricciae TaxID=249248 RepID=A0A815NT96_ADIRI|nr:unnamed protein product [Adineta ricciae]CAF1442593.1 unnamed protein product [Adineta ricciae]